MIFDTFMYGKTPFPKIVRYATQYMPENRLKPADANRRNCPDLLPATQITKGKKLHQTHVVIGGKAYGADDKRIGLFLLNNILGKLKINVFHYFCDCFTIIKMDNVPDDHDIKPARTTQRLSVEHGRYPAWICLSIFPSSCRLTKQDFLSFHFVVVV
jgi:predicted alpha/beta-hydrolase family hydrolase